MLYTKDLEDVILYAPAYRDKNELCRNGGSFY